MIGTATTATPEHGISAPYTHYADVYDRLNQSAFSERISRAVLTWLGKRGHSPGRVLDLACGTGAAARLYADHGCEVIGLDQSMRMLAIAREHDRVNPTVQFLEGDLRDLSARQFDTAFNLVSCYFDSISYLLEDEELEACFRAVRALTALEGYFVFDVPTQRGFSELWDNAIHVAVDDPDFFGLYQSSYDPTTRLSPLRLTFFQRDSDPIGPGWRRFDECHIQRAYSLSELKSALDGAGFEITQCFDVRDNGATLLPGGDEHARRVALLARPVLSPISGARD
ncbi:MAG: class I SAM-dependent methyltransferase [Chloroflexota bacterium]|nr:class I SAM-dependent methyltransferase [Chloroflexota bacterium]